MLARCSRRSKNTLLLNNTFDFSLNVQGNMSRTFFDVGSKYVACLLGGGRKGVCVVGRVVPSAMAEEKNQADWLVAANNTTGHQMLGNAHFAGTMGLSK